MSLPAPVPSAPPAAAKPARRSDARFLVVWAILVGALVVAGAASTALSRRQWFALLMFLYFGPYKVAALLGLSREERRRLRGLRLLAFFVWVGQQPRPFLTGYSPPATAPRPTWRGFLLNLLTGAALLWGVAWLLPAGAPLLVRAWAGLVGLA